MVKRGADKDEDEAAELATLVRAPHGALAEPQESDVAATGRFADGSGTGATTEAGAEPLPAPEPTPLIRAAQMGDLEAVEALIRSGEASAQDIGDDGTTALHWAAINNRLRVCEFLIAEGAVVDCKGGILQATPLHWACRNGLVYIAHLLLNHGADPLRTDNQGFNALHLATHSSNVLLVIYLLHCEIPVDTADPNGRTAAHWAAYQGDSLTVDVLLKWGSDIKIRDMVGFIPLHWAIVKGSSSCLERLIEEGSDVFAKSNDGKTAHVMAQEMGTASVFEKALLAAGKLPSGHSRRKYMSVKTTDLVIFLSSSVIYPILWKLVATVPWYFAWPIVVVTYYAFLRVLNDFIFPNAYFGHGALLRSPFLTGVFFASCLWTAIVYLLVMLPATYSTAPLLNILFVVFFSVMMYAYFASMLMDPGYVPKTSGINEQKAIIDDLIDKGLYDSRHFCVSTFVRKPLRSKYDRKSQRVIARFDHYCPWINNVVAVRNHRLFVLFVVFLMFGIISVLAIFIGYYSPTLDDDAECEFYPHFLCKGLQYSPFISVVMVWDSLQLIWVSFLVFVQLVQVSKSITTNEVINLNRYGYLGADDFSSLPHDHRTNMESLNRMANIPGTKPTRCWSSTFRILGIDQFVNTAQDTFGGRNRRSWKEANPASNGLLSNCSDFWFPHRDYNVLRIPEDGRGSIGGHDVDYYRLWEFPKKRSGAYEQV